MPAIPSWLLQPLWDQFAALLPDRPVYNPAHPPGCRKPRTGDRIISGKLIQVLRSGCSSAPIARESYDRIAGLVLQDLAAGGCTAKAPGGGQCAGRSPAGRGKPGMKRPLMAEGRGIPPGRVLAPANRRDSPLLAPALDKLDDIGPLPGDITVRLDAGYDPQKTRDDLAGRGITGETARKGSKAPIQAGQRWHAERTNAWHNNFNRLQRCYERNEDVINAFFDLAGTIITVRRLIREAWTLYRGRPARPGDHDHPPIRAVSKLVI